MVQAQVHTVNQNSAIYEEVELRLHTSISAHSVTGYEVNFRCVANGSQYVQIVRWEGPFGKFTYLANVKGPGLRNGDTVKATMIGSSITAYINGAQIVQATDNKFTTGSPGMGFYIEGGSSYMQGDYGFTSFSASDLPGPSTLIQDRAAEWSHAGAHGEVPNHAPIKGRGLIRLRPEYLAVWTQMGLVGKRYRLRCKSPCPDYRKRMCYS